MKFNPIVEAYERYQWKLIPTFTEVYASPTFSSTDLNKPELLIEHIIARLR